MFDYTLLKEFVKENPDAPAKEAAEKFGCTLQNVYTARHAVGVSKPVTMQKKKRLKVVRKSTLSLKDREIKRLQDELVVANQVNKSLHKGKKKSDGEKDWQAEYEFAVLHIKKIERILGEHKVVIGYLEHQLFTRNGQEHGASV